MCIPAEMIINCEAKKIESGYPFYSNCDILDQNIAGMLKIINFHRECLFVKPVAKQH